MQASPFIRALAAARMKLSTGRCHIEKSSYIEGLYQTKAVTFNWITEGTPDPDQRKYCIELEYQLRPRITRFLMKHLDPEHHEDISVFHFDVDLLRNEVRISDKTPSDYTSRVACAFMQEIGMKCC